MSTELKEFARMLEKKVWDESKHPRAPKGSSTGGEWVSSSSISTDAKGIHSLEVGGSTYWSKPGETEEQFAYRISKDIAIQKLPVTLTGTGPDERTSAIEQTVGSVTHNYMTAADRLKLLTGKPVAFKLTQSGRTYNLIARLKKNR